MHAADAWRQNELLPYNNERDLFSTHFHIYRQLEPTRRNENLNFSTALN